MLDAGCIGSGPAQRRLVAFFLLPVPLPPTRTSLHDDCKHADTRSQAGKPKQASIAASKQKHPVRQRLRLAQKAQMHACLKLPIDGTRCRCFHLLSGDEGERGGVSALCGGSGRGARSCDLLPRHSNLARLRLPACVLFLSQRIRSLCFSASLAPPPLAFALPEGPPEIGKTGRTLPREVQRRTRALPHSRSHTCTGTREHRRPLQSRDTARSGRRARTVRQREPEREEGRRGRERERARERPCRLDTTSVLLLPPAALISGSPRIHRRRRPRRRRLLPRPLETGCSPRLASAPFLSQAPLPLLARLRCTLI